jgi:hypothetical protein
LNAPIETTRKSQPNEADWGSNKDGWEFVIDNRTPVDLVPFYGSTSNIDTADSPIKAGATGHAKGKKSALPPFIFDGPADADLGYRFESAIAQVFIKGNADGTIKRGTVQDKDQRLSVYFPETPGDQPQVMVFQWHGPWGPNYDGWVFELTNNSGHDLIYVPDALNNVASYPARLANGDTGWLKGKQSGNGGPENCNFTYRHPDDRLDFGGIAISASSDATKVHIVGSKSGTTDIEYTTNPSANVVQTVRYKKQG